MSRAHLGWFLALGLAACGGEETTEPTAPEAPVEAPVEEEPTVEEEAAAEPEITADDLAIAADFEDEAVEQITADNLEAELAALEAEIPAEEE